MRIEKKIKFDSIRFRLPASVTEIFNYNNKEQYLPFKL